MLCPVPGASRILCSNVLGLYRNRSDLTVASSQYYLLLCSEALVSNMRHISEFPVPGFGRPVEMHPVGWLHMCEMDIENFANNKFECGCCEMLVFGVCGARQSFYVLSLSHCS